MPTRHGTERAGDDSAEAGPSSTAPGRPSRDGDGGPAGASSPDSKPAASGSGRGVLQGDDEGGRLGGEWGAGRGDVNDNEGMNGPVMKREAGSESDSGMGAITPAGEGALRGDVAWRECRRVVEDSMTARGPRQGPWSAVYAAVESETVQGLLSGALVPSRSSATLLLSRPIALRAAVTPVSACGVVFCSCVERMADGGTGECVWARLPWDVCATRHECEADRTFIAPQDVAKTGLGRLNPLLAEAVGVSDAPDIAVSIVPKDGVLPALESTSGEVLPRTVLLPPA